MELKKITKQQLYDFVDKQVSVQKGETQKAIDARIGEVVDPILDRWIRLSHIENTASKLADMLVETTEQCAAVDPWKFKRFASQLNSWIDIGRQTKDEMFDRVKDLVRNPQKGEVNLGYLELNEATLSLQKELVPAYQKLKNLGQLKRELDNVIATEPNGQRGYKSLVALGVDMKGFEASAPMLPAVVKLSVNPCLLTGDCQ
ncbi:hypothetical protein P4H46_21155 [Paenibacillus glucanolyticus]|uniref:hypothetical protein n=1 Tax=Paenibacillus glucanolyticus TaxID=59843 RepID=UPI0030C975F3